MNIAAAAVNLKRGEGGIRNERPRNLLSITGHVWDEASSRIRSQRDARSQSIPRPRVPAPNELGVMHGSVVLYNPT